MFFVSLSIFQNEVLNQTEKYERLKPENFDKFVKYYFNFDMGTCHKEWFKKYIFNTNVKKLLIEAPMEHAKSTYISVIYPMWLMCNNPRISILLGGSTLERSADNLRKIKAHFENNERLIEDFGPFRAKNPIKWTEKVIYIQATEESGHPSIRITAVGHATAGIRCDVFIGDDLVTLETSMTEGQRNKLKRWFCVVALTRVGPSGWVRILGTEYGENTLYQDIIHKRSGEFQDWNSVVYQAINEKNIGPNGELWPEYWPLDKLMERKGDIGTIAFEVAYQNNPRAMSGKIFKHEWIRYFEILPENCSNFMGVDLAISESANADYFAIVVIAIDPKTEGVYIIDILRDKLSFKAQCDAIVVKSAHHSPAAIGIESVAYQRALPQQLKSFATLPLKEIKTTQNKAVRMMKLAYYFENGKIFMKKEQLKFIEEFLGYDPDAGRSPDQLDALDFALEVGLGRLHRKFLAVSEGHARKAVW